MANKQFTKSRFGNGSALILTVVLTSLLAIVGVMFLLVSRLDKMATTGLTENKELNSAVDTVIAKISQDLAIDIPRTDANGIVLSEYYDYPDPYNAWLACLEPCQVAASNYRWRQISNITGTGVAWTNLQAKIISDYQAPVEVNDSNISTYYYPADADGDGVSDSVWVKIPDMTSSKGKPIYAAVRVIDNGGMLNVNTDYKFDPNNLNQNQVDGSSQLQINLMALSDRSGKTPTPPDEDEVALLAARANYRFGTNPADLTKYEMDMAKYEPNVIWCYNSPIGGYTPFDVGDELELRYRYLINQEDIRTRIEGIWTWSFNSPTELNTPIRTGGSKNTDDWFYRAQHDVIGPNDVYSYRHLATTYNMDRSIRPDGGKMVNVNRIDGTNVGKLYSAIYSGLSDANFPPGTRAQTAAQIAVNLIDYRDGDNDVTRFAAPDGNTYYGFEQPCIYISEIAYRSITTGSPPKTYRSYAVELYKPYDNDNSPVGWRLQVVGSTPIDITWNINMPLYVIRNQDSNALLPVILRSVIINDTSSLTFFATGTTVNLLRPVLSAPGVYIIVDSKQIPGGFANGTRSYRRDISYQHKCIRRLWSGLLGGQTLGNSDVIHDYNDPTHPEMIQAHPENKKFTNIGEIGMILRKSAYSQGPNPIGPNDTEATARLNLRDPNFQKIFNYLTVFPPVEYVSDPCETRIKGRININTAPWFVIAQLPWVSQRKNGYNNFALAQAIVGYRDTKARGFRSIGELNNIYAIDPNFRDYAMNYYALDGIDQPGFPDLDESNGEGAIDDFEERDLIFARISNLVTVRSDVFTAYILVRIGNDGPQKRVMAILDRSNVYSPGGKVRIVALHPVPDPR